MPAARHRSMLCGMTSALMAMIGIWPLGPNVRFVPGHGPMSTFGAERASNAFVADRVLARD